MPPEQLHLPSFDGYESRAFKTSIGGTITKPADQPAQPPRAYEDVVGIFVGTTGHSGVDAAMTGEERTPIWVTKINVSQALVPLSDVTRKALDDLLHRIWMENHDAALGLKLLEEDDDKAEAS